MSGVTTNFIYFIVFLSVLPTSKALLTLIAYCRFPLDPVTEGLATLSITVISYGEQEKQSRSAWWDQYSSVASKCDGHSPAFVHVTVS